MFGHAFQKNVKKYPPKSWTISEPSTSSFTSSQRKPKASWGFPTNILLRGHGCLFSVHPRPPSPREAVWLRNRGLRRLRSAVVRCLGSRSPRQATLRTQRNEGSKNSEKISGTSKVEVFGICDHPKIFPGLKESWKICWLFGELRPRRSSLAKTMWIYSNSKRDKREHEKDLHIYIYICILVSLVHVFHRVYKHIHIIIIRRCLWNDFASAQTTDNLLKLSSV